MEDTMKTNKYDEPVMDCPDCEGCGKMGTGDHTGITGSGDCRRCDGTGEVLDLETDPNDHGIDMGRLKERGYLDYMAGRI